MPGEANLAAEVEVKALGGPGVDAALDAGAGDGGEALAAAVVPVGPEIEALAGEAQAPVVGLRDVALEVGVGGFAGGIR